MEVSVQETRLKISGMSCGHCSSAVEKALTNLEGVSRVQVSLEEGSALIQYDPGQLEVADLEKTIEDAGYTIV